MKDEQGAYAKIVAEVKAEFAGKDHTGDEVRDEIGRRWAKAQGREYTPPEPLGTGEPAPSAPGKAKRIVMPDRDDAGRKDLNKV